MKNLKGKKKMGGGEKHQQKVRNVIGNNEG